LLASSSPPPASSPLKSSQARYSAQRIASLSECHPSHYIISSLYSVFSINVSHFLSYFQQASKRDSKNGGHLLFCISLVELEGNFVLARGIRESDVLIVDSEALLTVDGEVHILIT